MSSTAAIYFHSTHLIAYTMTPIRSHLYWFKFIIYLFTIDWLVCLFMTNHCKSEIIQLLFIHNFFLMTCKKYWQTCVYIKNWYRLTVYTFFHNNKLMPINNTLWKRWNLEVNQWTKPTNTEDKLKRYYSMIISHKNANIIKSQQY